MGWLRDYLKSILGVPKEPLRPDDVPRNIHEDFCQEFGHNFHIPQHPHSNSSPEVEWHIFQEEVPSDNHDDMMFQEGGDMFRQIEEMFDSFFQGLPFSPDIFHGPTIEQSPPMDDVIPPSPDNQRPPVNPDEPGSLRDRMLKQPDSDIRQQDIFGYNDQDQSTPFPESHFPSWFGSWSWSFEYPRQHPQQSIDKDLDSEVESGNQSLDDILSNKENPKSDHSLVPMIPRSSSKSYSSVTTIDSHGNTESRTTRRDSSGQEEVTVTRKIGDQEHIIKHRKNENGSEETEENIVNIDQDKLQEFNERWKQSKEESHITPQDRTPMSSIYESILDQFFPKR